MTHYLIDWSRLHLCTCVHQMSSWQCNPRGFFSEVIKIFLPLWEGRILFKNNKLTQRRHCDTHGIHWAAVCLPEKTWHGRLAAPPLEVSVWLCVHPAAWSVPSASLHAHTFSKFVFCTTNVNTLKYDYSYKQWSRKQLQQKVDKKSFLQPIACHLLGLSFVHLYSGTMIDKIA